MDPYIHGEEYMDKADKSGKMCEKILTDHLFSLYSSGSFISKDILNFKISIRVQKYYNSTIN